MLDTNSKEATVLGRKRVLSRCASGHWVVPLRDESFVEAEVLLAARQVEEAPSGTKNEGQGSQARRRKAAVSPITECLVQTLRESEL